MNFSEVFVIVQTHTKGSCYNNRIYEYTEAVEAANRIRSEFDWLDLAVISLDEYNEERYSYGYDSGYDSGYSNN
jgi:hypothetical protein